MTEDNTADSETKPFNPRDHLAISKLWYQCYAMCLEVYGTEMFPNAVMRFKTALIDLKDGAKVKSKVDGYYKNTWMPRVKKQIDAYTRENYMQLDSAFTRFYRDHVINNEMPNLFMFIIQTIEDSGIGFHATKYSLSELDSSI